MKNMQAWLDHFDKLDLECDGMTRVLSTTLAHQGVDHEVIYGRISNTEGVGVVHYWIQFLDQVILDLRARMWLGNQAPHGLFLPEQTSIRYNAIGVSEDFTLPSFVYQVMVGHPVEQAPDYPKNALKKKRGHDGDSLAL